MSEASTIWKYLLPIQDEYVVEMPDGATILSVDMDPAGRHLAVWASVWPDRPQTPHRFYVRGTGHPLGLALSTRFIGTAIDRATGLVWHVIDGGVA